MNLRALLATIVALGAGSPIVGATGAKPTQAPVSAAARIQADVARLAGAEYEGRRAGTEGADRAAEWIASELRRIGLAPAGENGTYFQTFTFVDGVDVGDGTRLATRASGSAPGPLRAWKADEDFRPLAFSAPGTVSAPVVFAGYGIVAPDLGRDDYAGLDVKDKAVLLLRHGPGGSDPHSRWVAFTPLRLKVSVARDRGARAVLVVTGPRTSGAADELVALRTDASLADAGIPAFSLRRAVAEALFAGAATTLEEAQRRADEGAPAPAGLDAGLEAVADVTPRRSRTRNVLAVLPGTDGAQAVLVGAHYDHLGLGLGASLDPSPEGKLHGGADDNASGVAGLLELARRLRGQPRHRSVVFAFFGAEELGVLGSSHYVRSPTLPLERVVAMLNLDMIGRLRDQTLHVHGTGTSPLWPRLLDEANASLGLVLKRREGGYGPSDHSPFYGAGRPVLFFFTGVHGDYHRPSDTPDRVDAVGIARVTDLVERVVDGVAGSAQPVAFTRVAAEKEQATPARGFRVWVGGIPDYGAEVAGVRFSGVTAGSPADKAGLQGGDVLVRFGTKEIRNIYDYTYALGEHAPGDKVPLVVKRDGREVSMEVVLGSRPGASR